MKSRELVALSSAHNSLSKIVRKLAKKRSAVILVHNYQKPEVQDIADYLGDSLELSQIASEVEAETIVFCGVKFMAETASILCPNKTVLIPELNAGCPMANMIKPENVQNLRKKFPTTEVICYVNSTAEVKAESDICCTSANAVKIVNSAQSSKIIFVPDKYLAHYVSTKTNKQIIPWNGYCPTHVKILPENIRLQKNLHPKAEVLVHPECTPPVIALADMVLSTGGMVNYSRKAKAHEFIVGTEIGLLYRLMKENPDKKFYPASELAVCPKMKLTTLEKVLWSLENMIHEINVPADVALRAKGAIDRMLKIY